MATDKIKELLKLGEQSQIPILLYGERGVGKTRFCLDLFSSSAVILPNESTNDNLYYIRNVFDNYKVVIFENITINKKDFFTDMFSTKYLLSKKIDSFIIATSKDLINIPNCMKIHFEMPNESQWLKWAQKNNIHPILQKIVEEQSLLKNYLPKEIEMISKILYLDFPFSVISQAVSALMNDKPEILEFIKEEFSQVSDNLHTSSPRSIPKDYQEAKEIETKDTININNVSYNELESFIERTNQNRAIELLIKLVSFENSFSTIQKLSTNQNIRNILEKALNNI